VSSVQFSYHPRVAGACRSLTDAPAFLSNAECKALFSKIVDMANGGGDTSVTITSRWTGSTRWARSRIHVSANTHTATLVVFRTIRGAQGMAITTRLDPDGLREVTRDAETSLGIRHNEMAENIRDPFVNEPTLQPVLWDDATSDFPARDRTRLVQELMREAHDAGLFTFGALDIMSDGNATLSTDGLFRYYPTTSVECSMTVRDLQGTASGWAGVNHYALRKIDPKALAAVALDKCKRMHNPSAVEPGRYTVILEPQAVADLFSPVMHELGRGTAEFPMGPFGKAPGRSKIGDQVLDRRLMVRADPMDSEGGFLPYVPYSGSPYQPVNWIDRGVLRELEYDKGYALRLLNLDKALPNSHSFRLAPIDGVPTSTTDEMIARTERGILVTRFYDVRVLQRESMLSSGYTRDGIWLIENGKITRPIKNFRFTESPLFALNKVEDIGAPQRVFASGYARLAPALRVRDFSFTGLADAV
jgi:predicted Zn-dependent protease